MNWEIDFLLWLNEKFSASLGGIKTAIFSADILIYLIFAAVVIWTAFSFVSKFRKYKKKNTEMLVLTTVSALFARVIIAEPLRILIGRMRPFEVLAGINQLLNHSAGKSFPSGHATLAFAVATTVAFYYPRTSIIFFLAGLAVGIGRIATGVHWPLDIIGGVAVGILSSWLLQFLKKKFWKK